MITDLDTPETPAIDTLPEPQPQSPPKPAEPDEAMKRRAEETWAAVYSNLDTAETHLDAAGRERVTELLRGIPNPAETKAAMVNQAYIIRAAGGKVPADVIRANWPAARAQYAKQALDIDNPKITDGELFKAIGDDYRDKENELKNYRDVIGKMQEAAIAGETDWSKALSAAGGISAANRRFDGYLLGAQDAFAQTRAKMEEVRPFVDAVRNAMLKVAEDEHSEAGGRVLGEIIADTNEARETLAAAAEQLVTMPAGDRALVYRMIAAQPGADIEKTAADNNFTALARGVADVLNFHKTFWADVPRLANLESLNRAADSLTVQSFYDKRAEGEGIASFLSTATLDKAQADALGMPAQRRFGEEGKDWRRLTDAEKKELADALATEKSRQEVARELRGLADGHIDPVKGDIFFTDKVWYPALRTGAYTAQAFVPYANIPMLFASTAGMRAEEYMARGVSAADAQGMALVSAIIETPWEYMQARLAIGKVPGLKKILEIPASTVGKWAARTGLTLGVEVLEQNFQEAIQDITPLVIQHYAAVLDEAVPGVDWKKELPAYGSERIDTLWALLPMAFIGTGASSYRDSRYLRNALVLRGLGFSEETTNAVMNAPTADDAQAIAQAEFEKRDPASPAAQAAREEIAAQLEAETAAVQNGALVIKLENGTYNVAERDGRNIATGITSPETAWQIKTQHDQAQSAAAKPAISPEAERAQAIAADTTLNYPEQFGPSAESEAAPERTLAPEVIIANATMPRTAVTREEIKSILFPLRNDPITNENDGTVATLSRDSIDKLTSGKAFHKSSSHEAHAAAAANVDWLFKHADHLATHPDTEGNPRVRAVHRYTADMLFNGEAHGVLITLFEYDQGKKGADNRIYSIQSIEVDPQQTAKPAEDAAAAPEGAMANTSDAGFVEKVRQRAQRVKSAQTEIASGSSDVHSAPLQLNHANQAAINFERPPDVRPGAGVNASQTIASFANIVKAVGGSGVIRVGKFKQKALGIYDRQTKISRILIAGDVSVAAHELAHALEDALFGIGNTWGKKNDVPAQAKAELEKFGRDIYGDKIPTGGYKTEGFAEYVRLHLTDPAQATKKAPAFDAWWKTEVVARNHKLASVIATAQRNGTLWFQQGSVERMTQQIAKPLTPLQRVAEAKANAARRFEKLWLEAAVALRDFTREAAEKKGISEIDIEDNPFLTLTTRRLTADSKAGYMAMKAMIDIMGNVTGRPLIDAFKRAGKGREADFILYLWARRALALWDDPKGPRNPGIDRADAAYVMQHYDSPAFAEAAQMVYDWNNGVLEYAAQSSPSYAKAVESIRKRDPGAYIPLFREFDALDKAHAGAGGVKGKDLLKRLQGSGRPIKPPVESMLLQAKQVIVRADRMRVLDLAINLAEGTPGMGHWINRVPRDMVPNLGPSIADSIAQIEEKLGIDLSDKTKDAEQSDLDQALSFFTPAVMPPKGQDGYGYISRWDGEKIQWYEIASGLYETLASMDAQPAIWDMIPVLGKAMKVHAKTLRLGTTALRASFALVTNPTRDFRTLYYNTRSGRNGAVVFANWLGAMFNLAVNAASGGRLAKDSIFIQYKDVFDRLGLEMSGSLTQDAAPLQRAARRIERGGKASKTPWKADTWRDLYDGLLHLFQFGESASRVAEVKMVAEKAGWDPSQPMTPRIAAMLADAGKTVTTDFTRSGTAARQWNMVVPFFNAGLQGKLSHYEAIKRNPARWLLTRGLNLSLLAAANWWINKDEEWWRETSEEERLGYDLVRFGNEVIKFPRAFDVDSFFMGGTTAILDAWYAEEPERVRDWFTKTASQFTQLELGSLPPSAKLAGELLANRNSFTGAPIVPRSEMDIPEWQQYNEYTTRAAIEIGKIIGQSPRRIDHAIRSIFGGVGADVAAILGRGDGRTAAVDREYEAADIPVLGVLFHRGGKQARNPVSIEKLYEAFGKAKEKKGDRFDKETQKERLARLALTDAVNALQAIGEVRHLTPERAERQKLTALQIDIAKDALDALAKGSIVSRRGRFKQAEAQAEAQARSLNSQQQKK